MLECQLVPWELVRHLLAKWCLVIVVNGIADGTSARKRVRQAAEGGEEMHFVPVNFTECDFSLDYDYFDAGRISFTF